MEKIAIRELTASNIDELSEILKKVLSRNKDSQIFISNNLLKRILEVNKSRIIWEENVVDGYYYNNEDEKAFIFKVKCGGHLETVQMHFVKECLEYVHLTCLATKGLIYQCYRNGMKKILIIN